VVDSRQAAKEKFLKPRNEAGACGLASSIRLIPVKETGQEAPSLSSRVLLFVVSAKSLPGRDDGKHEAVFLSVCDPAFGSVGRGDARSRR
jgi:hypothetical protein